MIDSRLRQVINQVRPGVPIPVIVELRTNPTPSTARELAGMGLGNVRPSATSPLVYGKATADVLEQLNKSPIVAKIFYDEPVYTHQFFPFGQTVEQEVIIPLSESVRATGAPKLWEEGYLGQGVKVAVIDTGVSQTHPMLRGALKGVHSAVPNETVEDANSHGTWCCAAVAGRSVAYKNQELVGMAPAADLYALKALSDKGSGQMSWVMECIEKAITDFQVDIISMSLGSLFDNGGVDPISRMVNDVTQRHNVLCTIAVGNSFLPVTVGSPGGAVGALTVGAVSLQLPTAKAPASFSSKGPATSLVMKPDCAAPGGNILAPGYMETILAAGKQGGYASMAGSSMATPHVAGGTALLRQQKRDLSRLELEQILAAAAFPNPKDTLTGYGFFQVDRLATYLGKAIPPVAEVQKAIAAANAALYAPIAMFPRPETEELRKVRLPVFRGLAA
ncbi:MAG: S8 family serine peptidase [Opitutaceae bacterium]